MEKRRNYNVPKIRTKKANETEIKQEEDKGKEIDENEREMTKEKNLIKLLENKQNSYIRDFQKMVQDTTQSKESKEYENKRKVIEDYGIDLQSLENIDDEEDNLEENKNMENENKDNDDKNIEEKNNLESIKNDNNNDINNNNYIDIINNNNDINMDISGSIEKSKEKKKKSVNTFEYFNQIRQNINYEELKNLYNNFTSIINTDSLGESSKKSKSNSAEKKIKKEEKEKEEMSENSTDSETGFNYKTKKNKRSKTEIREYMKKQKERERYKEEQKLKEKQAKKLNRFLGLSKLNEGINSNVNKNISKIKEDNNRMIKKEKIPNEYLAGQEYSLKRKNSEMTNSSESSQSTVLDQSNYYNDLIISKNILLNNYLNYIDGNMMNNLENQNDENNEMIVNNGKEIQNQYNNNNNNLNNEIIQENKKNVDLNEELYLKCKETLDRFNKLFSDIEMQNFIKKYKANQENKNNWNKNDINNNIENKIKEDNIDMEINISDSKKNDSIIEVNEEDNNDENNVIIRKEENNEQENDNKKEIINEKEMNKNDGRKNKENITNQNQKEEKEKNELNNEDIKEIINKKKSYYFSQEDLENYYQIFVSLEDYIISLIKKNALNDIINYGDTRLGFKIGIEHLIQVIKSYPYNILRNAYQKQYYKDILRQMFMPYIRRAFNNIYLYVYHLTKFSEVNNALEQIYKIIFIKRLIFYGQGKDLIKEERQNKMNEFLNLLINKLDTTYKKIYFKELYENIKEREEKKEIEISNNDSSPKKYNTYLYESFSEKSSLTAYPNTEGSARLHKVYELLEMQGKEKAEENIDSNTNRSAKSEAGNKSKNIFGKIKEEKETDIPYEELVNNLNNEEKNEIIDNENKLKTENDNYQNLEISNSFKLNINNKEEPKNIENNNEENNDIKNELNVNENKMSPEKSDANIILEENENNHSNSSIKENEKENKEEEIIKKEENPNDKIESKEEEEEVEKKSDKLLNLNLNNNDNIEGMNLEINNRYPENNESERNENKKLNEKEKILNNLKGKAIDDITDDLCENILSELIKSEVKDKKKIMTKKKNEINLSINNSSGSSLPASQNSMSIGSHSPGRNYQPKKSNISKTNNKMRDIFPVINSSQTESMLNNSIFMRTIDEIKKEKNLNLYNDIISKKFLEQIEKNIEDNYNNIIENLKIPLEIDEDKMINGLMLKDKTLSSTSKIQFKNEDRIKKEFIDSNIINDFEKTNKEIRIKDNIYDTILNKGVYDAINEIIEKERKYGIIGAPLSWSVRSRDLDYKYKLNDNFFKSLFTTKIMNEIKRILNKRMGLIPENNEYLDMEQLNQDRDKKFMESIKEELKDNEPLYQIFETQETYVKLSLSKIILDQLFNEIVEILEHVQFSRREPEKYQSKSIYACEDIPRLSFQPQTNENNYSGDIDADENINQ